jgi:hypothetical protein
MSRILCSATLLAVTAAAHAHDGHGFTGSHSHATDLIGFLVAGIAACAAIWATRK